MFFIFRIVNELMRHIRFVTCRVLESIPHKAKYKQRINIDYILLMIIIVMQIKNIDIMVSLFNI